ncbi:MAG: PmoA family protein [Chitinophagaceae bacterium]
MRRCKFLAIGLFSVICLQTKAQKIATFEVQLPAATSGLTIPASIDLNDITFIKDSSLVLQEVTGSAVKNIPYQIMQGDRRTIYWSVENDGKIKKRTYQLVKGTPATFSHIAADNKDGALTIQAGNKNLLRYVFTKDYPPAGVDSSYARSGFIHPLWTPGGQELTRIQAPDHYHHYGIWNPWTHVLFEGDTLDFWNIGGRRARATVRFAKFISVTNGDVFSEFEALHEHVVLKDKQGNGPEKVALNELQTVRVYKPEGNDGSYFLVDITSKLSCATQSPFHILAYRYAGLGWRTTGFWDNNNCEVLTSEGKTRANTDNTSARWCIVQGALPDNSYGGAVMLSYPGNYNHPEPMRIWTLNTNGRGDMFANFSPTKDIDWVLEPGKTYVLKYRFVVFTGKFDKAKAESAWQYFAAPPKVTVKK